MSDHGRELREAATGADAIQVHAADWVLARRLTSSWNEADQEALDAWRESSLANHLAYLRLDAAWERAIRLEALRPLGPVEVEPRTRRLPGIFVRIAAVVGVVGVLGAIGAYLLQPSTKTYSTGIGGHELVTFADGTKIELNTNTVLHARMTTSERVVWLEKGEAFFQVKHDPAHPFVVMAGDRRVTDLGTKFLVRRDSARFEVAVVQGRVWFDASGKRAQAALLSAGDDAIASANAMSVTKKSDQALNKQLGWRQGMLVFERVTLADAASEFNRYNARKIVFADPQVADHMIGGTFPATDVVAFTSAVQIAFGLHVQNKADEIVISH